ncbi:MAG: DUF5107 domain-containing protein [Anaerolineales bacterium]|nr:DUF5107 domain-containing protein [Anaerolineales bacterium]
MTTPKDGLLKVRSFIDELTLPGYELLGENRNPVFHSRYGVAHIYPYTLQDEIASKPTNNTYRTLNLENEYLRVTVLPQLGGRVYSVFDKIGEREVFYKNSVVKFSPLAIRGAFYSGGVEFSFPVAHAPTTADPVNWEIVEHEDGGASIVIGGLEHISGMRWIISLTLFPGRCALAQDVRLFNPTPIPGRYHYWTNASLISDDQTEFIYPLRRVRSYEFAGTASWPVARLDLITGEPGLPGMEGVPMWPAERMHRPINFRWEKDMLAQVSIFGRDVTWDFFGAWQHSSNSGYAHFANAEDVAGMKLWSWGRSDVGIVNQTALTDDGSIYAETQCGAMETQLDFDFLAPGMSRTWREWWLPLRDIGGLSFASAEIGARLHLSQGDDETNLFLSVGICPAIRLEDAKVEVSIGEKNILEETISCSPEAPWSHSQTLKATTLAGHPISLEVIDSKGDTLLEASHDRRPDPVPNPEVNPINQHKSSEDYYQLGLRHVNFDKRDEAIESFQKAISLSDEHGHAHLNLGLILLRAADFEGATPHFARAVECDVLDGEYYLGLVARYRGQLDQAEKHLKCVPQNSSISAAAHFGLGCIALQLEEWEAAVVHFRAQGADEAYTTLSSLMIAIALRRSEKEEASSLELKKVLDIDPLNLPALREYSLIDEANKSISAEKMIRFLADDPQYYLDLAGFYLDCGLQKDALSILNLAAVKWDNAMVFYLAEWICQMLGDEEEAAILSERAQTADVDFIFPSRLWETVALNQHLAKYPNDPKAKYFLGNFLYAHQRYDEAAQLWMSSLDGLESYDVLHRNLGLYHWQKLDDPISAMESFETALKLNPENQDLYILLDTLYRENELPTKRAELLSAMDNIYLIREDLRKRKLLILVELNRHEDALNIMDKEEFVPLEMDQSFHWIYVNALLQRAESHLEAERFEDAIADYKRAMDFPENHGVGKPTTANNAEILYRLGCTFEQLGQFEKAIRSWQEAAKEHHPFGEDLYEFVQLSLDKLGRYSELGIEV